MTEAAKSCSGLFQAVCRLVAQGGGGVEETLPSSFEAVITVQLFPDHIIQAAASQPMMCTHQPTTWEGGHVRGGGILMLPSVQHDTCPHSKPRLDRTVIVDLGCFLQIRCGVTTDAFVEHCASVLVNKGTQSSLVN